MYMNFESREEIQEYLDMRRRCAGIFRPRVYKASTTVPSLESATDTIQISSEGDFICEELIVQFGFDSNDLPKIEIEIIDSSNATRSLTGGYVPLACLASIGKTGNQLIVPLKYEHLFTSSGSILLNYRNTGDQDSVVDIVFKGSQFVMKGK